ncbi:MAG: FecR domain-containing protein, partial [Bacteroidota bacterium]
MDINRIITKHFAGETNLKEELLLKKWIAEKTENAEEFQILKQYWETQQDHLQTSKASNWLKLQKEIKSHSHEKEKTLPNRASYFGGYMLKVAASLLFIIAAWWSFTYYVQLDKNTTSEILSSKTIEKYNPAGRKSTIKLPDGSIIKLNSESSIKFPERFTTNTREIELKGEAFLEITKDPSKPFIVKTGNIRTKVLGTSFNIKAIPDTETVKIALVEGAVQVTDYQSNMDIFLKPGEMVTAKPENFQKSHFDYNTEIGWKDGLLVFKDASPKEIF